MNQARLRQRSLLEEIGSKALPQEIEAKAFELLVELFLAVVPVLEGGKHDEQDQK